MDTIKIKAPDIALEASLLKAMAIANIYTMYIHYIDIKKVLKNTAVILEDYKKYYTLYPNKEEIDFAEFYTQFSQHWHTEYTEQEITDYRQYVFPAIQNAKQADIEKVLVGLLKKQCIEEINTATEKEVDVSKMRQIIDTYEKKIQGINGSIKTGKGKTMFEMDFSVLDKSEGIPWCLPSLQKNIMSITKGQLILISGDTNSGKSLLIRHQIATTLKHFLRTKQIQPIFVINSEGVDSDVAAGVLSNIYKAHVLGGFEEIVESYPLILSKFKDTFKQLAEKLIICQVSEINNIHCVKKEIELLKPAIVYIDIIDSLATEEDPITLKKLYDDLRVMAGQYCPIVGTTQAGNQEYYDKETNTFKKREKLTDKALYGSKQKGGAADSMIMIGQDNQSDNIRHITITKKKRGKSVKFMCQLYPEFSYFEELQW